MTEAERIENLIDTFSASDVAEVLAKESTDAASEIARLQLAVTHLGKMGNTCVYPYLKTQCTYCRCDGRNMD